MSTKDKPQIASDTVKTQIAALTLKNEQLRKQVEDLTEENKTIRTQNVQLASVIENDLKADLTMRIMATSDFKEADLENLSVAELQTIAETLSKSKGADALYKPIRAGNASEKKGRLTVGDLYGKTRAEILAMGGDF